MKKLKYYIPIIAMLVVAAVVSVLVWRGVLDVEDITRTVSANKTAAFFVLMALFLLKGVSLGILYGAVLFASAMVYDLPTAIAVNILGSVLCISASYLVGRTSKSLTFQGVLDKYPKFGRYLDNADEHSFLTCFVVHSLHLSTEVQGVLFGLIRTPYLAYISSSMIALLPNMLCYTVFGSAWDYKNPLLWIFLGLDAVVVITGLILGKKYIIDK